MLFALIAFATMLLGFATGAPLADYGSGTNSTDLAARFVVPSIPAACHTTNVFCFTVQTGKAALAGLQIFGKKPSWSVEHDGINWHTYAWTYTVAGAAELQCHARNPVDSKLKASFGFSVGGTSYVSLSTDAAVATITSDRKTLTHRGSIETDTNWADITVFCKDW